MKVLVVGAAGDNAGLVVPELVARGVQVRGVVRDPSREEAARRRGAEETVVADLGDVSAVRAAAEGVDGVFGVIPVFAEDEPGLGRNLVRAAEAAGVGKVVFCSVYHPSLPLANHQGKQPAEAALYESELDFTVLQPAMFMPQLDAAVTAAARDGVVTGPYSATARMSFVDLREVAEVAAAAFVDDRLAYGTFELAAPGMYSRVDIARLLAEALGRPVTAEAVDFERWADGSGMPAGPTRDGLRAMFEHYDRCGFHGGNGLVLSALLGRTPRTVADYLAERVASA